MKKGTQLFPVFSFITGIWLILNLILIPLNWTIVFHDIETISRVERFMLSGFFFIILFDISIITWIIIRYARRLPPLWHQKYVLAGALFCLFLLAAAKVMADEVGRESRLGLGVTGEFIILYILFGFQLVYNIFLICAARGNGVKY